MQVDRKAADNLDEMVKSLVRQANQEHPEGLAKFSHWLKHNKPYAWKRICRHPEFEVIECHKHIKVIFPKIWVPANEKKVSHFGFDKQEDTDRGVIIISQSQREEAGL